MNFISKTILAILVAILIIIPSYENTHAQTTSIGVSPSQISDLELMPGNSYTRQFTVSRSDTSTSEKIQVEISMNDGIGKWISTSPENLELKKGENRKDFNVEITIPEDAEFGEYTGNIRVRLVPVASTAQVQLFPGVRIDLQFIVGENVTIDLKVLRSSLSNITQNQPLHLAMEVENRGNASDSVDIVELEVTNLAGKPLYSASTKEIEEIDAFDKAEINYIFKNHDLQVGQYLANLAVSSDGDTIYTNRLSFEISEEVKPNEDDRDFRKILISIGLIVGLSSVLAFIIFVIYKRRKDDKNPKKTS